MSGFTSCSCGWQRDLPDPRDFSLQHERVQPLLAGLRRLRSARPSRPSAVNWQEYFPALEGESGHRGAAGVAAALVEYFERRAHGRSLAGSRRFLDRMARRLLMQSDDGATPLRAVLKAIRRFGLPPDRLWPHSPGDPADREPPAFLFSYASDFHGLVYVRLDPRGASGAQVLAAVRAALAAGLPVAFGFSTFDSLCAEADVPYPTSSDSVLGGQAVVAQGFDDARRIYSEKGALNIRGGWGPGWGDGGCGWLPYRFVTDGLAADFWTALRPDWLQSGEFSSPL